jgi:hypothetical protein
VQHKLHLADVLVKPQHSSGVGFNLQAENEPLPSANEM